MTIDDRLKTFNDKIKLLHNTFLGYPQNQAFHYDALYKLDLFSSCINNLGDPYIDSNYRLNSKDLEQEVIRFFAQLYHDDSLWGYVTADGTEGNLYGIYLGRELYPAAVLYYSEDTHYSVSKAARMYRMDSVVIKSQPNGEMDYEDFETKLNRSRPAVVNANIGTTMKGAIDNLDTIFDVLEKSRVTEYYVHCDAALSGMLLPFLDGAPEISFNKNIGSVSLSGHKFIGCPIPCGVVVTRRQYVERIEQHVEYLGTLDTTILGSRCGLAVVYLWYAIMTKGREGFRRTAETCIENAKYLLSAMQSDGYPAWRNEYANTVYFKRPADELIQRWQLAKQGDLAHVVVEEHATREKLDKFLRELLQNRRVS